MLADIFVVSTLTEYMKFWKRYVNDSTCFVKMESVEYKVSTLNSFDVRLKKRIKNVVYHFYVFYLQEINILTTVFHNVYDFYLNWNSFAPTR